MKIFLFFLDFVEKDMRAAFDVENLATYKERRIKKYFPCNPKYFCLRASMLNQQWVA